MTSRKPTVYFFCRDDETALQEDVVALAEGFRELGVPFYGNCDYWREHPDAEATLIRHDPHVRPEDCDIVIVSYFWAHFIDSATFQHHRRDLPAVLFQSPRRFATVVMDNHDGYRTESWKPAFRNVDLVLRAKLNRRMTAQSNMKPWALALNARIIGATANALPFRARARRMLVNFGASHPYQHGARALADARVIPAAGKILEIDRTRDDLKQAPSDPYDALMWRQTGYRFSRSYYERLKSSQAVACFCGEIIPSLPRDPSAYLVGGNVAKIKRAIYETASLFNSSPPRSLQWDSFRFWETLAAGSVAVNIDIEHYGVDLPEMPTAGTHYLGVILGRSGSVIEQLLSDEAGLEAISERGRQWALEAYGPRAQAQRLLSLLGITWEQTA